MPRECHNIITQPIPNTKRKRKGLRSVVHRHYDKMSMQYTVIFHGYKNDVSDENCDIFLIFAQNIDHGYTLEPPQ